MSRSATIVIAAICALIALSVALALTSGARSSDRGATQHVAARPGQWRVIGPGGGGAQFFPAISPHDSNTVLVACDMTGAYITHDGGRGWRMFNLRAPVHFFGFDPRSANRIDTGADGLWRSDDSGSNWNIVFPPAASVTGLAMADDHASVRVVTDGGTAPEVRAMAMAPNDAAHIYLDVGNKGGSSWRQCFRTSDVFHGVAG